MPKLVSARRVFAAIKGLGVSEAKLEDVKRLLAGNKDLGPRLPRRATKKLRELCSREGACFVTLGKSGSYRVYTVEGYKNIEESGRALGLKNRAPKHAHRAARP